MPLTTHKLWSNCAFPHHTKFAASPGATRQQEGVLIIVFAFCFPTGIVQLQPGGTRAGDARCQGPLGSENELPGKRWDVKIK